MSFEQGVQLVKELGVTVAVLAYFIFRDYKFMNKLDSTLDVIKEFVKDREKKGDI